MRSLDIKTYHKMIMKMRNDKEKAVQNAIDFAEWMKAWDETRTKVNPNAKWYEEEERAKDD